MGCASSAPAAHTTQVRIRIMSTFILRLALPRYEAGPAPTDRAGVCSKSPTVKIARVYITAEVNSSRGSCKGVSMRLRSFCVSTLFVCLLVALSAQPAGAQILYGSILGTIGDPSGGVVPNASVTMTNIGTDQKLTAAADEQGRYTL